ncbi:MAG: HD domain-containing phosphohydrolase [Armatimonadota bacterium]|nr:HD domain-containing phosphohydrolase [Armatimonadota bacterium]
MTKRIANAGLRVRVLLVVLLAAAPVMGLLTYAYLDARRAAARTVEESAHRLARLAALEHERLIAGTRYLLFALANEVRYRGADVCVPFFAGLKERYAYYANVGVVGLDGRVVCSGIPTRGPVHLGDRSYFKQAIATHDFAVGEYQIGRFTGRAVLAFGFPVVDDAGAVTAVVFAGLDLSWLNRAAAEAALPAGTTVTVIDRNGVILAQFPEPSRWVGRAVELSPVVKKVLASHDGATLDVGPDGVRRIYGFRPLGQSGQGEIAHVLVGLPLDVAYASVNRIAARNAAGLGVILLLVLAAAWYGSEALILRPVQAVVAAARRLREGDLGARVGLPATGGELGQLLRTFDEMASVLQEREQALRATEQELREALADAQRRLTRLRALRTIDLAILGNLDLRRTLSVIVSKAMHELRVHAADILLLDARTQTLESVAARGFRSPLLHRPRLALGEGPAGRAAQERAVVTVPDLSADPAAESLVAVPGEAFVAYWAVPLIASDRVTGVLELFHRAPLAPDAEWEHFLETLAGQAAIAIDTARLLDDLRRAHDDLARAYDATLAGWSRALDLRDRETEGHTQRVTDMTLRLAEAMGVARDDLVHIRRGALLHDIGKMGIPDRILTKPAPLTPEEWAIMRRHPVYAYEMLSPVEFLRPALDIPYAHHEKWDGTGYPRGLKGEAIPLAARIFAVVDAWDALRSDRPYRPAWSEDRVLQYLRDRAGRDFDPEVVDAFLRMTLRAASGPPAASGRGERSS